WLVYRDSTNWDKIDNNSASVLWGNVIGKPETFPAVLGTTASDAYRGDRGNAAYLHSISQHAPAEAQKNSDITIDEINAKLIGLVASHYHAGVVPASHGDTHVSTGTDPIPYVVA